jgi:hypothetical protein
MHAVVVNATRNDIEKAEETLRSDVAPRISKMPGFVAGYWTAAGTSGLSMMVFESEDGANAAAGMIRSGGVAPPDTVTIDSVEIREVVASA